MNFYSSFLSAFLLLIVCQLASTATVGKTSANNETESDIDLVLDLLSGINFNVSDLNDDVESSTGSTASSTTSTSTVAPEKIRQQKGPAVGNSIMSQWLKDFSAGGKSNNVLGVPKLNQERQQPKGLDDYYPKGTQSLRNFARNNNKGQGGLGGFGQGMWGLLGRSLGGGAGIMNPFPSIAMTLYGGKSSLRLKIWLVKELYREEEQNRRRQSFDRSTGDLRTRLMRSMVQKSFNHYKKNTAMMEMIVQDRNERLQRFMEIPGVASLLSSDNDNFSNENDNSIDALSILSQSLFSLGGFFRNIQA